VVEGWENRCKRSVTGVKSASGVEAEVPDSVPLRNAGLGPAHGPVPETAVSEGNAEALPVWCAELLASGRPFSRP
jgi:hypothetical protein